MAKYNKYRDPAYRQAVRDWVRGLRAADRKAEHEQQFRDGVLRNGVKPPNFREADVRLTEDLCDVFDQIRENE